MNRALQASFAAATLAATVPARAQLTPAFEVAPIRASAPQRLRPNGGGIDSSGLPVPPPPPPPPAVKTSPDGLTLIGASLRYCMRWAYDVRPWQISGPDWIDIQRFDITAKTAGPATVEQLKLMLQRLLAERFRMQLHREKRDAPVMALVVGKNGPKFHASAPDTKPAQNVIFGPAGMRSTYRHASLDVLEGMLAAPGWDPMLNMTGLTGGFDFTYERPPRDPENPSGWLADIQASVQTQLGLRLERRKAPLEFLVIDRAESNPSEN